MQNRLPEPSGTANSPAEFLARAVPGTRVVARYRIASGFTDALGYLQSNDGRTCDILTRRGLVTVTLAAVVAAKAVPEPPARRSGRSAASAVD